MKNEITEVKTAGELKSLLKNVPDDREVLGQFTVDGVTWNSAVRAIPKIGSYFMFGMQAVDLDKFSEEEE